MHYTALPSLASASLLAAVPFLRLVGAPSVTDLVIQDVAHIGVKTHTPTSDRYPNQSLSSLLLTLLTSSSYQKQTCRIGQAHRVVCVLHLPCTPFYPSLQRRLEGTTMPFSPMTPTHPGSSHTDTRPRTLGGLDNHPSPTG
ncbi:hypothetical protein LX36DRAFT_663393 [Colletotrichum falcatum]|nr:hypothetical protein LX36DRAFT_663393 [Colletotrichum falcatum]